MFHSDFVALPGNDTRNFVARHKLGFNASLSLCLGIELVVLARAKVRIPRQIRRLFRHRSPPTPLDPPPFPARSGTTCKKTFLLYYYYARYSTSKQGYYY